jgi:RimJ/RimL family protein N-acetyltransferase
MSNTADRPLGEVVANTNAAPWPSEEMTIEGKYVTLEPLSPIHAEALFPLIGGTSNERLWDYMPYDPCPTSVSALHSDMITKANSTDPTFYTILKHTGGGKKQAVGWCSYLRIEPKNRVIEVGHLMFSSQLQKSAAATEAMYLMAKYAFEGMGYRRYEWKCHSLNGPSRRAAKRYGFVEEGTFRQALIDKHGRNRDTTWFSMLDSEWDDRKRAFEGWLSDDNFDADGKQKKRLEEFRV